MLFRKRTAIEPLVERFKKYMVAKSLGTPKAAKTDCNRLQAALDLMNASCCEAITPRHISTMMAMLEERGLKAKTLNNYREVVHRFLQHLLDEKGITFREAGRENPAAKVRRRKEPAPVITFLELAEAEELLDSLSECPQLRAMVAVIILAGLRRGELLWLTPGDVDLRRCLIHVRAKTVRGEFWQPKTATNRSVPISTRLREELALWQPPEGSVWHFPSPEGQRWHPDNFSRALRVAQEEAEKQWNCLDMRHTFGTWLARSGVSLFKIARLMGNSPAICQKHYAHLVSAELRDEVELAASLETSGDADTEDAQRSDAGEVAGGGPAEESPENAGASPPTSEVCAEPVALHAGGDGKEKPPDPFKGIAAGFTRFVEAVRRGELGTSKPKPQG